MSASRDIAAGTVIDGRYEVISRIGSGGMADVYLCQDAQLGRQVALKLLHRRFAEDEQFVERFRREAQSAAGLQHPNVVSVFDRGTWDGTSYIAMEHLEGRTLKQLIRSEAPLPPVRAIDLTLQMLYAARFAHKRGIIHRDLKPQNAIVDAEDRLKVTDFGIARAGASDMTETGSILGTAQYLSPEQAQGHPVGAPSDLYAVGIVLYELLTGHVPFDGDSAVTIALKHVSEPPAPPSAYNPAVTPALEGVVLHALQKDPNVRFQDADSFIAALEEAREDLVNGGGQATSMFGVVQDEPDDGSSRRAWIIAGVVLLLIGAGVAAFLLTRPKQVEVPDVVRQSAATATTILQSKGFEVVTTTVTSNSQRGRVIGQDPQPGTKADEGSRVTLRVSGGPEQVVVPQVEGLTEKSATGRLRRKGLESDVSQQNSDEVPEGRVIRASPSEGTPVDKGSSVTLIVSSGKRQVGVPGVVGQSRDRAQAAIEAIDLKAVFEEQEDENADPGTVLSQDPAANAMVAVGSVVTLKIAKAPDTVKVPRLVGLTREEAATAVSRLGLVPEFESVDVDRVSDDGVVRETDPRRGEKVKKGSTVTLVIGKFTAPDIPPETPTTPTTTSPSQ